MLYIEKFSERFKELRTKKGYSQEKLGKAVGFTQAAIANIESGERGVSVDKLIELAQFFNVSLEYLLGLN